MAEVQQYQQQVLPTGSLDGRSANAGDFGAGIGAGLQDLGHGMGQLSEAIQQQYETEDVTNAHVQMAQKQVQYLQQLQEQMRTATPGDDTFGQRFMQGVVDDLQNNTPQFKTRAGQQLWQKLSASTAANFGEHAINAQGSLASDWAKVQNTALETTKTTLARMDPANWKRYLGEAEAAIDDPNGIYGKVNQAVRDSFKQSMKENIAFSAMQGMIQQHPEMLLNGIAPDLLNNFKPTQRILSAQGGGQVNVASSTLRWQPQVSKAATKYGVDSSILLAQIDQESSGNPNAVNNADARVTGFPSVGIAQFQPGTAQQYGVNPKDPVSSIVGQAHYMSDLLQQFGGNDYRKALAAYNWGPGNLSNAIKKYGDDWFSHIPASTQDYVTKILAKSGTTQGQPPSPEEAVQQYQSAVQNMQPIKVDGLDAFNVLSGQQQYRLIQEAEAGVRMNIARDQQKAAMDKEAILLQQQKVQNDYYNKLLDKTLTVDDIRKDTTLTMGQREQLVNAINAQVNGLDKTDPRILNGVLDGIQQNQVTDPQSLYSYVGRGISLTDVKKLQDIVVGKGTPDGELRKAFMEDAKGQLDKSTMIKNDPVGKDNYYKWFTLFTQEFEKGQQAGKTPAQMLNPTIGGRQNPDYLGWTIDAFKRSPKEQAADFAKNMRGQQPTTAPAGKVRLPGETIDAYMKRVTK